MARYKTNENLNLPEEIMNEIFLRCSVESLLRAKCVCKHWNALIINPNFTFNHLQYQKRHDKGRLLLQHFEKETESFRYLLFDDETLAKDAYHKLDHFPLSNEHCVHMEGPIDGLYCLYNCLDRIIVWNPALKKPRCLTLPHPNFLPHIMVYEGCIGFGIDPLTNYYKLVLIRLFVNSINDDDLADLNVTVYNFRTNTWKLIDLCDNTLQDVTRSLNSAFLKGTYYWSDFNFRDITAFDMGTELFRKIAGPLTSPPEFYFSNLTIYKDHVASLALGRSHIDVWVMLDEGNWVNQLSITHPSRIDLTAGLWKTGEILYATPEDVDDFLEDNPNSQMVLCDIKTRETRKLGPTGLQSDYHASVYYESLVSVDCGEHKGKHASLGLVSNFLNPDVNPYLDIIRP